MHNYTFSQKLDKMYYTHSFKAYNVNFIENSAGISLNTIGFGHSFYIH